MSSNKDKRKSKSDVALNQSSTTSRLITPSLSLLVIEIPETAPSRVERSLDANTVDEDSFLPNSTFLEYVGEVRAPDRSSNASKQDIPLTFENDRRFSLSDAVRSDDVIFTKSDSYTGLGELRAITSAPFELPNKSYRPLGESGNRDSTDSGSQPPARKSSQSSGNFYWGAARSFDSSESDDGKAIVENMKSPPDSLVFPEDETLYKLKTTVPAPLDESVDIKFILENVQKEMRNSIELAAASGSSNGSIITISKPVPRDEESSSNPEYSYSDDSKVNSNEIRKKMFAYTAPKRTAPPGKSQRKAPNTVPRTQNSSPSDTVTNAEKAPPNSRENTEDSQSFQSSKNSSTPKCKQTSGSEEVLSEMGLYQREVEKWLRTVVEVVKEELETLYENKVRNVKSKTDPESTLKKTSRKKKSSKRKKFPYYPSGVIIPKCRPKKQKKALDSVLSSKPRFSDLFDSYYSENDTASEFYPEVEGEYEDCYYDHFLNERPPAAPANTIPSTYDDMTEDNSAVSYENTDTEKEVEEYEETDSEPNVLKGQSSKQFRKAYVNQWVGNVAELNNNLMHDFEKRIGRSKQTQIPSKLNSKLSSMDGRNQSNKSQQFPSVSALPAPFTLSIDTATQMYEEALRDCKRDGEIFHQNLAEKFTRMHMRGLRRIGIQKKLHDADIRRAALMDSKLTHLRNKSAKRLDKAFTLAKDKIESQTKINLMKMMEAKVLETKGVLKLFKDTMNAERRSILEMKVNQKSKTRKVYAEVNEQISKLESLLQHGTNDLDKISSKLRKTSSLDTIELLNSLHKKGYQQLQTEINKCITNVCSTFLLQK